MAPNTSGMCRNEVRASSPSPVGADRTFIYMLAAQDLGSPDNCSKSQGGMCSVNFNAADVLRWSQRAIANRAALSRRLDSLSKAIYATDYPMTTCSFTDC